MSKIRIVSWNVNGIRATMKKGFEDVIINLNADVFMVQETKATVEIVKEIAADLGWKVYANEAEKKGYSGTAIFTKLPVISDFYDMNIKEHDLEGRISGVEFDNFFLVNVYVPNSGSELKRLDYRKIWDGDFLKYLQTLNKKKPVVVGGDFNVAHTEIDLARPKANYNKTSGFTQIEIDGIDNMIKAGFIDSFRNLHPEKILYTFWSQRFGARAKNVGWRIDYFLLSPDLKKNLLAADIYNEVMGSDHCPISVELSF